MNVSCSRTTTQWRRWGSNTPPLGPRVRASLASLRCGPYFNLFLPSILRECILGPRARASPASLRCGPYFNLFLPSVIRTLYYISEARRDSNSVESFTNQSYSDISPSKKLYFQGNSLAQIYHIRLRTSCSTLRLHLYPTTYLKIPSVIVAKLIKAIATYMVSVCDYISYKVSIFITSFCRNAFAWHLSYSWADESA